MPSMDSIPSPPSSRMALPRAPPPLSLATRTPPLFSPAPLRPHPLSPAPRHRRRLALIARSAAAAEAEIEIRSPSAETPDGEVLLVPPHHEEEEEEGDEGEGEREEYDWREEWYPLYLSAEVPADAPLGVSVFDKQLVLFRDGQGIIRCFQDRCPHRLAKLSEGQLIDGRLECLYHGWQFGDDGRCLKIPQLPLGAKIPRAACAKTYEVRDSQGVVWVWMSDKSMPDADKLPWFEHYARPDFQDVSTIHELPYDHSIVLENLMDPAHVPISHDRTDYYSKREDAQPLLFEVTERSNRGFAGTWNKSKGTAPTNFLRFEAPCVLQNNVEYVDKNGKEQYVSSLFLCRPTGQGKSTVIIRFGTTLRSPILKFLPKWYFHQNICKVLEQDMGFLSSQNEVLMKEKVPTGRLYLSLRSLDTWVLEYRKWKDKVGHGMPYYFGHRTSRLPEIPAVLEHASAGFAAGISASMPAKGGIGDVHAPNPINRYFRHIVHCKECRSTTHAFQVSKNILLVLVIASVSLAILVSQRQWKILMLSSAALFLAGAYACSSALALVMTNFIRTHRRL